MTLTIRTLAPTEGEELFTELPPNTELALLSGRNEQTLRVRFGARSRRRPRCGMSVAGGTGSGGAGGGCSRCCR
jgi:hypothetical protein